MSSWVGAADGWCEAAVPWDWDAEGHGKLECQCAASGTRVPREERHAKVLSADRVAAARQRQAE